MNKQITEDYCSFEVAKLLKEKGFINDWCVKYYDVPLTYTTSYHPLKDCKDLPRNCNFYDFECSAPTYQMALKWLREVHNIHIEIRYVPNQFTDEPSYKAMIWDMSEEIGRPLPDDIEYAFYETCVNNALKYTLENLI